MVLCMSSQIGTDGQLVRELEAMRQRVAILETASAADNRIEKALKASERRLRFQAQLLDSVRESIIATDLDGYVVYWGRGAERLYGYAADDVTGELITFIVEPPEEEEEIERMRQVCETGSWRGQYIQRKKDGTSFWSDTVISLVTDDNGRPCGMVGIDRDITKQKHAERALREAHEELEQRVEQRTRQLIEANASLEKEIVDRRQAVKALRANEERFRLIAENVTDIVWTVEIAHIAEVLADASRNSGPLGVDGLLDQWRFSFISPSVQQVIGYSAEEAIDLHPKDLLSAASFLILKDAFAEELMIEAAGSGDPLRKRVLELEHITKDGKRRWCEIAATFLRDENQRVVGVEGITRDITTRKNLEKRLSESIVEQQQQIGQQLHDELGQQLLGLGLMAKGLQRELEVRELPEARTAGDLVAAMARAQDCVRAVLRGIRPVEVDCGGLMAALADLAAGTEQLSGVPCTFECQPAIPVEDNHTATQLYHIAQEAVRNAMRHSEASQITLGLVCADGHLRLLIRDNGKGIAGDLEQLTGMGIRIMRHRASVVHAGLTIESAEGRGTLVVCTLPLEQLR